MSEELSRSNRRVDEQSFTAPPTMVGRRALLGGGLIAAGAATASVFGVQSASAVAPPGGNVVYGPAPATDGSDDAVNINAAIYALRATGGVVLLPPGTYNLQSTLYAPQSVDLQGSGGGLRTSSSDTPPPATTLKCSTATGGVHVWGYGGTTGNLCVDGNGIATTPFVRGPEGTAVSRTFEAISVVNSAQDGIQCLGSQNDAWYDVKVSAAARDCLVLDQGYGGALFSRCEIASAGRYNIRIDKQISGGPYASPSDNVFHQCIFEYDSSGAQSVCSINGGVINKFDHCSFYSTVKTTGPLIDVFGQAQEIVFEDCLIQSTPSTVGGTGLRVDYGTVVSLTGTTHFQNFDQAIAVQQSSTSLAAAQLDVKGLVLYYNCTARYSVAGGLNVESLVLDTRTEPINSTRRTSTDLAYVSQPVNAAYRTVSETAAGTRSYGPGTTATDVSFGRVTKAAVGVNSTSTLVTGWGSASTRPAATAALKGAIRLNTDTNKLEVCTGTSWV